ncbi:MAG: CAP domain-containing protein [Desulfotomaculaceae bacterium]|nr:CAP domain-containing protein [Desulfotomaculaceae bacterium]
MRRDDRIRSFVPAIQLSCNTAQELNADEILLLSKVNEERAKSGLPLLSINQKLVWLARIKSNEMFEENYFSHISPVYGTALDMIKRSGITARVMGAENIAKAKTVLRVHTLLMSSKEHRDNILNPLHDAIGIGVLKNIYGVFATQLFIGR